MKRLIFGIFFLAYSICSCADELSEEQMLPDVNDIFTIAIDSSSNHMVNPCFTPESLIVALPEFKSGEAELKVGAKKVWQSGVIVLKNKKVLFWRSCRKNFIHIQTSSGYLSFIRGDGKENL